jgi:hypothetical protein
MRITLSDSTLLDDLVRFLAERGCVAQQADDGSLDVFCLSSTHHDAVELELDLYLQRWNARHPDAPAALVHERGS